MFGKKDELTSNADLTSDVGELSSGTPEESVLLAKRLVDVSGCGSGHLGLVGHVRISNFSYNHKVSTCITTTEGFREAYESVRSRILPRG